LIDRQLWDEGPDILALQQFLNTHGFPLVSTGWGSPGNETDTFGLHTYAALIKFQEANNLPATGYFGPLTRALLGSMTASSTDTTSGAQ
jgi:peptidoglycan hydrolase-like protein with peptidoglycan-binding domain